MRLTLLCATAWVLGAASVGAQVLTFVHDDAASDSGARAVVSADFNRDGWPDVAHANIGRNSVTILLNHHGAGLVRAFEVPVGLGPFDLTTGDFNRDGIADLAVANADGDSISILLGRGDGTFTRADIAAPLQNPRGITTADVNRDGRPDLITRSYLVGGSPRGIALADVNDDGRLDVMTANRSSSTVSVLAGDRAHPGAFLAHQEFAAARGSRAVVTGDFNGDGRLDVATGNEYTAAVR